MGTAVSSTAPALGPVGASHRGTEWLGMGGGPLGASWSCPLPKQVAQEAFDDFGGINDAVASCGDISLLLSSAEPSGMPQRKRLQPAGAAADVLLQVKGKGTVLVCLVLKEMEDGARLCQMPCRMGARLGWCRQLWPQKMTPGFVSSCARIAAGQDYQNHG